MNSLEQHVIVKGGSVCLFGTAEKGYQWSNLGGDYVLSRLLCSKRTRKVLCLNLDRNPSSLESIVNVVSSSSDHDSADITSKLEISSSMEFWDSKTVFEASAALNGIKTILSDWVQHELSFSIVIYSLSELILSAGFRKATAFVKELLFQIQELTASNSTSISSPSVVFIVHESLHPPAVITQLQSLVSTIIKIVPNSGTLSPEVVAEMQTIRKSATTGKVMECIEMFGYRDGLLYPMKTNAGVTESEGVVETSEDADEVGHNGNNSSSAIMNKLLSPSGAVTSAAAASEALASSTTVGSVGLDTSKRLITFDSTDPEFDEDSDPDADLDL